MLNFKKIAKQIYLFNWVNSKIKCYTLKQRLRYLNNHYKTRAKAEGFYYDQNKAIEDFKRRRIRYCSSATAVPIKQLRIFWVGTNEDQDESGFLDALRSMGKVIVFFNDLGEYGLCNNKVTENDRKLNDLHRFANDAALIAQVEMEHKNGRIDLLIGQMSARWISKSTLACIQKMGVPVINISMDDKLADQWPHYGKHWGGSSCLAPNLDLVLTSSPETCTWYGVEKCPAIYWPLASCPNVFSSGHGMRDIDVLFIGNKYGVRGKLIRDLEEMGIVIECYGDGWPNGYANVRKMAEISKRAKIILGIGTVGHCSDIYTIKLRDFDAPMSGALYLTQRNPDLMSLYCEGKDLVFYESSKEAAQKIKYYLSHPLELEQIARNGNQTAIEMHTWQRRISTTFRDLGLIR